VATLTIARTSMSMADLVIDPDWTSGMWVASVGDPDFAFRYTYAPDSAYVAGSVLLAAVLQQSALTAVVYVSASTGTALQALKDEVAAAVSQFTYSLSLTVDGVTTTWSADPTWPQWGEVDSGMVAARMARAVLSIPVNPA
jgi:hypothetical protein